MWFFVFFFFFFSYCNFTQIFLLTSLFFFFVSTMALTKFADKIDQVVSEATIHITILSDTEAFNRLPVELLDPMKAIFTAINDIGHLSATIINKNINNNSNNNNINNDAENGKINSRKLSRPGLVVLC